MRYVVSRLIELGVDGRSTPPSARRVRTINAIAGIAIVVNLFYIVVLSAAIAADQLPLSELLGLLIANTAAIAVAASVPLINRTGRVEIAMWTLFMAGLGNTIFVALFLGRDTGAHMFMLSLPAFAMLITRRDDRRTQIMFLVILAVAFTAVIAADLESPASLTDTAIGRQMLLSSSVVVVLFIGAIAFYFREIVDRAEARLDEERERSEELLLNILPRDTADRLKAGETVIADRVDDVSVLFADIVGSTPLTEILAPRRLVEVLNGIFSRFDDLADELGLEKIKTMGDAYLVVAGLPRPRRDHLEAVADMALAMRQVTSEFGAADIGRLRMRFGIDSGTVIAGVIGKRKFSYDLWGDTVVTAARMESHGLPGEIQVTGRVRAALEADYLFEERGPVDIKGKGTLITHLLKARRQH